jgi:hypothetical protein
MPITYKVDTGLEELGKKIIAKHRPMLGHLKIQYMFRSEASIADDKVIAGRCVKVDDRNRTIHGFDFIIEIAYDLWETATDEFKEALMDHELGHCGLRVNPDDEKDVVYDDQGRPKTYIKTHSIEEFEEVLERHGAYHKNLRQFLRAFAKSKSKKPKEDGSEPDLADTQELVNS